MPPDPEKGTAELSPLATFSVVDIIADLRAADITFEPKAGKIEFQALWAMQKLGYLDATNVLHKDALATIVGWLTQPTNSLVAEVEKKGLPAQSNKWKRVQALIENKYEIGDNTSAEVALEDSVAESASEENAEPESSEDNFESDSDDEITTASLDRKYSEQPDHRVTNLLVAMFHAAEKLLPDCPFPTKGDLGAQLEAIEIFDNAKQLNTALNGSSSTTTEVLSWMCDRFGKDIIPADGTFKISAMPEEVHQFVVARQMTELQKAFDKHLEDESSQSMLLYHGMTLRALLPILCTGFIASEDKNFGDGNFMCESPLESCAYFDEGGSAKGCGYSDWHSIYREYGVLLGCEVAGNGRKVPDVEHQTTHVVTKMYSILVRYIILIRRNVACDIHDTKTRKQLTAAFKKMRAGKFDPRR